MTSSLAIRLIEQFASQAPFAIWITDSRGVAIFANRKLHEMFDIPDHPSGALGHNLFEDPAVRSLHLEESVRRAARGEIVDVVVQIPSPDALGSRVPIRRKQPLTLKVSCFALRSSAQKIEHYVLAMSDVTEAYAQREKLRQHLRDLKIFNASRKTRLARLAELHQEAETIKDRIRKLGGTPAIGA